ncbi:MAG: phenylalanine--tRNA ligase subunit beta [Candidatus Kerfeldbacteria bacterium]|nr:phenylalanine--tRNA ligase subunit beta [Candidatus Kerfeldbacteria bacterium]
MLLSYAWLKTYLPKLPAPDALASALMAHGLDVDGVTTTGQAYDHVVVGEITAIKPHPNADKLRLADVVIVPNGTPQEVVCGAPNIAVGQKVPIALIGARLPNGLTIEPRAIRGVTSNGMLCAADELGLGSDHSGILVLDPASPVGASLASVLDQPVDTIFDVATPANRADLLSLRGLAWEIGAMLGQRPKFRPVKLTAGSRAATASVSVKVEDNGTCPVYNLRVIRGLSLKPSPRWLKERLASAGMRSINAIVDVTNYIMLEYGQPLHAFDAAKSTSRTLAVRMATSGEMLTTLDGKSRHLEPTMVVIADGQGPVALAGVMGGKTTEVSERTTDIYLESAIFNPVAIRKTSRQLGLVSEASKRFERGLWPSLTRQASDAAAALLVELCSGEIEQGSVTVGESSAPARTVALDPVYISARLGEKISAAVSKKILTALGFTVSGRANSWTITIPEWRPDVALAEDVVDEVGRIRGYEDLPVTPLAETATHDVATALRQKEEVCNLLVAAGFTEVISHAFFGERQGMKELGQHFTVANPLDETQQLLRKGLLSQLFETLKRQAEAGQDAAIFEIGRVFDPTLPGAIDHQQPWKLALGMTHKQEARLPEIIEELCRTLATPTKPETLLVVNETFRGRKIELCQFDLQALVVHAAWALPDWEPMKYITTGVRHRAQSKYPAIKRDVAFWWPHDEAGIAAAVAAVGDPLLQRFEITDRFAQADRVSYTINVVYQAPDRTLTKTEVDKLEQRLKALLTKAGATIR